MAVLMPGEVNPLNGNGCFFLRYSKTPRAVYLEKFS
jgi:hypothetical protein